APIVAHNPDLDLLLTVPPQVLFGRQRLFRLPRELLRWRNVSYDLVLSFHAGQRINQFIRLLRGKGFVGPGRGNLLAWATPDGHGFPSGLNHYVDIYPGIVREAATLAGIAHKGIPLPKAHIEITPDEQAETNILLGTHGLKRGHYLAVFPGGGVNPGESGIVRRYPAMASAIALFLEKQPDVPIVFLGLKSDTEAIANVTAALQPNHSIVDLHGKTTLRQYASLLHAAGVVVTGDSSAMHIASACNIPTVAIFGPTDPRTKVNPLANVRVLAPEIPQETYRGRFLGDPQEALRTFEAIDPHAVATALLEAWFDSSSAGMHLYPSTCADNFE
ncbi:MAG: glycosyltransferase family 9 protein, partial [Magnetococcales bacterium]|nr:glycosyltransferase family 9 protein [Magnetococcales bacterium]